MMNRVKVEANDSKFNHLIRILYLLKSNLEVLILEILTSWLVGVKEARSIQMLDLTVWISKETQIRNSKLLTAMTPEIKIGSMR